MNEVDLKTSETIQPTDLLATAIAIAWDMIRLSDPPQSVAECHLRAADVKKIADKLVIGWVGGDPDDDDDDLEPAGATAPLIPTKPASGAFGALSLGDDESGFLVKGGGYVGPRTGNGEDGESDSVWRRAGDTRCTATAQSDRWTGFSSTY